MVDKAEFFNNLYSNAIYNNHETSVSIINKGIVCDDIASQLGKIYSKDVFNISANELLSKLNNSNSISKLFNEMKIKKILKQYLINYSYKIQNSELKQTLENIIKYQKYTEYISENSSFLKALFADEYQELSKNYSLMKEYYDNTYEFKQQLDKLQFNNEFDENALNIITSFKILKTELCNDDLKQYKLQKVIDVYNEFVLSEINIINNFSLNASKFIFKNNQNAYSDYLNIVNKNV